MTTPIIVPIHSKPATCPECHAPESIKETCRHCGYEYAESNFTARQIFAGTLIGVAAGWLLIASVAWAFDQDRIGRKRPITYFLAAPFHFFAEANCFGEPERDW